jgi:hypothetical protein
MNPRVVFAQPRRQAQLSPPVAVPPPRWHPHLDEAYFADERGAQFPPPGPKSPNSPYPLYENKYRPQTKEQYLPNPLVDPGITARPVLTPTEADSLSVVVNNVRHPRTERYRVFVPKANPKSWADVTILFSAANEMTRAGLRRFFDNNDKAVLIQVAGVEPHYTALKKAWGVGITDDIVRQLLAPQGIYSWNVTTLACYSTGYRGFNESIEQLAASPKLKTGLTGTLTMGNLRTAVIYDALYEGSDVSVISPSRVSSVKRAAA